MPKNRPAPIVADETGQPQEASPKVARGTHPKSLANLRQGRAPGTLTGRRVMVRLTPELEAQLDAAKGELTDSKAIRSALEYALTHGWRG